MNDRRSDDRRAKGLGVALVLVLAGISPAQDAERATHVDSASTPQVSFETRGQDFVLRQYQLGCLSHLSYLLVSKGEALVVDPQRDVEHYLRDAESLGGAIRYVALTHPHADFVAGHTELAHRTGAEILIGQKANAAFAHHALRDGDKVQIGAVTLEAWDTPGHTPNAQTLLLHVPGSAADPAFALTGDTLFIGSIGRPDLLDVPPAELAAQSFASVQRLKHLPAATMVLPAHGAGSLCGAHLSTDTTSTIGRELGTNPYLKIGSEASFVANVISHQPVAPQYFRFNVALNLAGPPLVERSNELPPALAPAQVQELLQQDAWLVDLRDQDTYARGHVSGSVNVALRGRLDTWTGIVVPFESKIVLLGDVAEVHEGSFRLRRIGLDHIAGYLDGGVDAWRAASLPVRSSKLVQPQALAAAMQRQQEPILIDVRTADEYQDLRLGDVGNIPLTESDRFARTLDKTRPVVMVCNSAYRSSMAVGLAERLGFADVGSLDGGLDAWIEAGLPVIGRLAQQTATAAGGDAMNLPEAVEPAQLQRWLMDQPQAYAVIDVRPAWQFAEWHLGSAINTALADLAAKIASLPATTRVVLVDRDGTTAFAAAGALMAREPQRVLRVLVGGVQRYYREVELGAAAAPMPTAAPTAPTQAAPPPAAGPAPAAKKRSAGC